MHYLTTENTEITEKNVSPLEPFAMLEPLEPFELLEQGIYTT